MSESIPKSPVFATTHWSVVLAAGDASSPEAAAALEELCRGYWFPLYAYARRSGQDGPAAEDLTQEFFARLLQKDYLRVADRRRGRFRWFLLTAFKCFLANEWDRERALKRGGGQRPIPLDGLTAEQRYQLEPADHHSADLLFERRWALTLLEAARAQLQAEFAAASKSDRFNLLEGSLPGERVEKTYAELGQELGMSEGAVKTEVHRMKRRYAELMREEVARTVADPAEVDLELRHLIDVLGRQ
jgi:RNA polymerase sigma-70 factor (ECF subfamily)